MTSTEITSAELIQSQKMAEESDSDLDDCFMTSLMDDSGDDAGADADNEVSGDEEHQKQKLSTKGIKRVPSKAECKSTETADASSGEDSDRPKRTSADMKSVRQMKKDLALKVNIGGKAKKGKLNLPSSLSQNWKKAITKASSMEDPWSKYHIEKYPEEVAVRYRYKVSSKEFLTDKVVVKMEPQAFNRGAMRQCFRLKKRSEFSPHSDWSHGPNYVAKRYFEDVERDVYFEDVRLQMEAKRWGELYDRCNPPKKVDIFQMSVLEFIDRPGKPLYHLEHFIEGEYNKYNSNSGFVDELHARRTPHAFSHFTFERSGHRLIIVDIQGVGDLYTDPQIHTWDEQGFGDGNLGTRGMALFFHSHVCNDICRELQLSEFDLSPNEKTHMRESIRSLQKYSQTEIRSPVKFDGFCSASSGSESNPFFPRRRTTSAVSASSGVGVESFGSRQMSVDDAFTSGPGSPVDAPVGRGRVRFRSSSSVCSDSGLSQLTEEEELQWNNLSQQHRPSAVHLNVELQQIRELQAQEESILGRIHFDLAVCHEIGRFRVEEEEDDNGSRVRQPSGLEEIDWESAVFHYELSASLGCVEAHVTLGNYFLDLPRDHLVGTTAKNTSDNIDKGVDHIERAANLNHLQSIVFMAKAFASGAPLGSKRSRDLGEAVHWYGEAVELLEEQPTQGVCLYELLAAQAELLRTGGPGLSKNASRAGELYNEAGEQAMAAMKGRLANKYYMISEECYAEDDAE